MAGYDKEALYLHYTTFGKSEGRLAVNPEDAGRVAKMQSEIKAITISFAGDCTLGGYKGQDRGNQWRGYYELYGNDYFFKNVKEIFEQDDITFVNLEGALMPYEQVIKRHIQSRVSLSM